MYLYKILSCSLIYFHSVDSWELICLIKGCKHFWISWHILLRKKFKWKRSVISTSGNDCCCLVAESCLTLFAAPWTIAYQVSLSVGIPRQEYWSQVVISFSRGSSWPRDCTVHGVAKSRTRLKRLSTHTWVMSLILRTHFWVARS